MKFQVYAALKDYFDTEFELDVKDVSVEELKQTLTALNPAAKDILSISRFAVDDTFVDNHFIVNNHETVHIIPPSSGG